MEVWKKIDNYPTYQISSLGNVKSLNYNKTKKEKILKIRLLKSGYCRVGLCKNGKAKDFYIHRLVADSFLFKKTTDTQVNHINGIKNDNRVDNLEWCTQSENMVHSYVIGLNKFGEENYKSKLTNFEVLEIKKSNLPYPELSKLFNVSKSLICCIKKGKKRIIC